MRPISCYTCHLPSSIVMPLFSRLLSEGPRLSASISSAVPQPPSQVPETTKQAEASHPPPYTHNTYHHTPPASGVMAAPPQQSLYTAASTDYSSLHQPVPIPQQGVLPPPSQPSMTGATLSSSPGSWSHNAAVAMGQLPSLSAYSANPLQQQRYVYVCGHGLV